MKHNELRRYTNLAAVIRILSERSITLLPPDTWDDLNDRRLLEAYGKKKQYQTVLALCFSEAAETYHHWKTFAAGNDGMCVVFKKDQLIPLLSPEDVSHRKVDYYTIEELAEKEPKLDDLPFSKRVAYKPEAEYRFLHVSKTEKLLSKDIVFPSTAVARIIINPWLPQKLAESVTQVLKGIEGFSELSIVQSKVIDGPSWRRLAEKYA